MPRPPRCRRICQAPQYETFSPEECPRESEAVTLTLDEYEVIRLSQKFMKLPGEKLPDVSSLDSALS